MQPMTRAEAVRTTVGSMRLEGLAFRADVAELLAQWAAGEVDTAILAEAERRLVAGQPLPALAGAA